MTPERSPSKRWSGLWRMSELMLERLATKPKRWDGGTIGRGNSSANYGRNRRKKCSRMGVLCLLFALCVFNCVMWIANKISTFLHPAFSGLPDGQMRYQRPSGLIEALATKAQRYRYTRHSILLEAKREST